MDKEAEFMDGNGGKVLTFCIKYATFFVQKSCDEDMLIRKDSQRGCSFGARRP